MAEELGGTSLTVEDLEAALRQRGGLLDVTVDDLLVIFRLALEEAEKRRRRFHAKEWIRDIMKSPVVTCTPETTVVAAARILLEHNLHCLPVVIEGDRLVGLVTESDLMFQFASPEVGGVLGGLLARKRALRAGPTVADVMVRKVVTVRPEEPIRRAIQLMLRHGYGRLPVVEQDNLLVGIVARKDLLSFLD